jgi:hypothetical protein
VTRIPKIVQFLGIVITGIGLIYGINENDMRLEFMYLGSGIVVFAIGYFLERR